MKKSKSTSTDSIIIDKKNVGSSESQIGLLSKKIANLMSHFTKNKNDKHSTWGLVKAVNQRKRLLTYLKKNNPESYTNVINKFNLRK